MRYQMQIRVGAWTSPARHDFYANGNALVTPSWGCYWFGQWLANLMFAIEQGMQLIAVHKQEGHGLGALDRFPSKQDWEGTDGKQFSKDGFLGGSQVCKSSARC